MGFGEARKEVSWPCSHLKQAEDIGRAGEKEVSKQSNVARLSPLSGCGKGSLEQIEGTLSVKELHPVPGVHTYPESNHLFD